MEKKVTTIPATLNRFDSIPLTSVKKRKVAGYARVSTAHEEQATSYSTQVNYYTTYIKQNPEWEYAGIYTDEGITATNTKHRKGFQQMIEDALEGKIDLIITKSVSRFARNTVDSLTTVRKLKKYGVEIYFEKENIWTFDSKGELLITIMSSLAQEESRSISENVRWAKKKSFANGQVTLAFDTFLGYDRGLNGEFVINEEQAEIVRYIYKRFLDGLSAYKIAKELTEQEIKSPGGKDKWYTGSVINILKNEKYKGDALLQKTYIKDFLSHKSVVNHGEIPQYYIENHHEGIISPEQFEQVQAELSKRKCKKNYRGMNIFSGTIKCGDCGFWYGTKTWNIHTKYEKTVYICNKKYKNKCKTPHLVEQEIKQLFIAVVNQLFSEKDEISKNTETVKKIISNRSKLNKELKLKIEEINAMTEQINNMIVQNSKIALSQQDYQQQYHELKERYDFLSFEIKMLSKKIEEKKLKEASCNRFIKAFNTQTEPIAEFDDQLWSGLVEEVIVYSKQDVRFHLKNGLEVHVGL